MKNIELTEDHKSKLLEMCKVLFPEIKSIVLQENLGTLIIDQLQQIHWFEFCITKIVNELAWRNIKTDILADCEYEDFRMKLITEIFRDKFTTEKFHIVDYLYKEFKNLN